MTKLSAVVITRDEEGNLPGCLESLSFADEIVVLDSGSTDRTVEIARDFGCTVYEKPWTDFSIHKKIAVELCTHSWVLNLDADERLPEETRDEVIRVLEAPMVDGYVFNRLNYLDGRLIRFGAWRRDEVLRLFRKERATFSGRPVHESVLCDNVSRMDGPILHMSNYSAEGAIQKVDMYSTHLSRELYEKGGNATQPGAVLHACSDFLKHYILKLGFLDGPAGFNLARTGALIVYNKYVKLIELCEGGD